MKRTQNSLIINNSTVHPKEDNHIPSTVQADTLFHFTDELKFIINYLTKKMLSPRYSNENISYLHIKGIDEMAFPMKCFCDINLHKLEVHIHSYGFYGIAFSKDWGMKNKIQPIQYINPKSILSSDFTQAFNIALNTVKESSDNEKVFKNFLMHELMYWKPYQGEQANNEGIMLTKCFTDECEWRFVPDVTEAGFDQVLYKKSQLDKQKYDVFSDAMDGIKEISLQFEYADIKYIIVKSRDDFKDLSSVIKGLIKDEFERSLLISKIIVWDESKGDF